MTQQLSASLKFSPSLATIPEEEPQILHYRTITVVPISGDARRFQVKIPIFNVNIYAPEPPKPAFSVSYQRLLREMDSYIGGTQRSEQYRQMVESLRKKVALEQAENWRISKKCFSDRDWYWYSQQTGNFTDAPLFGESIGDMDTESVTSSEQEETDDNTFDLNADF